MPKSSATTSALPIPPRRRWKIEDAQVVLAALKASGLSVQKFAKREGLDVERLYRWRRQLGKVPGSVPTFVELQPSGAKGQRERIQVILRSGHILFIPESLDAGVLRKLVDVLEQEQC